MNNEEYINDIRDLFDNLKSFQTIDDIPDIPYFKDKKLYEEIIVKNLLRCGAIPIDQLEIGKKYKGTCRNTSEAIWNGKEFEYERYKWGMSYIDTIHHFQDDDGYDVFVPIEKIINT